MYVQYGNTSYSSVRRRQTPHNLKLNLSLDRVCLTMLKQYLMPLNPFDHSSKAPNLKNYDRAPQSLHLLFTIFTSVTLRRNLGFGQ